MIEFIIPLNDCVEIGNNNCVNFCIIGQALYRINTLEYYINFIFDVHIHSIVFIASKPYTNDPTYEI